MTPREALQALLAAASDVNAGVAEIEDVISAALDFADLYREAERARRNGWSAAHAKAFVQTPDGSVYVDPL